MTNEIGTEQINNLWIIIEWFSVILGVGGTIWAALFKGERLFVSFILWIISGISMTILHIFHTQQLGLLTLAFIGLVVSTIGLINSKRTKTDDKSGSTNNSQKVLLVGFLISFICSLVFLFYFLFVDEGVEWYKSPSFEMFTTFINICGLLLISSNSKYSKYCWIFWTLSNGLFVIITYSAGYMGLMSQQIFFSCLNIWGLINWFVLKKNKDDTQLKDS